MYVVLEIDNQQIKVGKGEEFSVNRIEGKKSEIIKVKHVMFAKDKNSYHVGTPYLKDAHVTCEIMAQTRGKKVVAFKYKKRKSEKIKTGHRQDLTRLKVTDIKI